MKRLMPALTVILIAAMITTAFSFRPAVRAQDATTTPSVEATPSGKYADVPLDDGFVLVNVHSMEQYDAPKLSIEVNQPKLTVTGSSDTDAAETAKVFNDAVAEIVQAAVYDFRDDLIAYHATSTPYPEIAEFESFVLFGYEMLWTAASVLSIRFEIASYSAGAAHPNAVHVSLNFDLRSGKVLELSNLFAPDSDYLEVIAAYAAQDLQARDALYFPDGALPIKENYTVWNLTEEGLLITFNIYQVMPYVAGPQFVTIPYEELAAIQREDGALTRLQ
jgi:hypothetical protein